MREARQDRVLRQGDHSGTFGGIELLINLFARAGRDVKVSVSVNVEHDVHAVSCFRSWCALVIRVGFRLNFCGICRGSRKSLGAWRPLRLWQLVMGRPVDWGRGVHAAYLATVARGASATAEG